MSSNMGTVFLFFNLYTSWLLICSSKLCLAGDTLNIGEKILGNETFTNLVSAGKIFELGFFTPSNNDASQRYLGIWYHMQEEGSHQPQKQTVVWVANRDSPVAVGSIGVFQIALDGSLEVVDTSAKEYWSSPKKHFLSFSPKIRFRTVKLMDSGNLVLYDDEHLGVKLWESFENPTDTFLPGMKMDRNLKLTGWKTADDPGSGDFSFILEQTGENRFVILNRNQIYWESEMLNSWRSKFDQLDDISLDVYYLLTNLSSLSLNYTRLLLDSEGLLQWMDNLLEVKWMQPRTQCLTYNFCGNFTRCNDNDEEVCKCLPGFSEDMETCKRTKSVSCARNETAFLNLTMIKTGRPDKKLAAQNETHCKSICLEMCSQCQAYSYAPVPTVQHQRDPILSTCWIWTQNLTTLKEEYTNWDDRRLIVLVDKSDLGMYVMIKYETLNFKDIFITVKISFIHFAAPTPRTCEPCGTNVVPYPLSTGSNCGDNKYFNFTCNSGQGQLSFSTNNNDSYRVIRVEPNLRNFIISNEVNSLSNDCHGGHTNKGNLKISSPFQMISHNPCYKHVEVLWEAPSEPICNNSVDCLGWKHSTCNKDYRCVCNTNYNWSGESLRCTESKY